MKPWQAALIGIFSPLFAVAYVYVFVWILKKIDKL